jgi:DNA-binding NtrC family response regulator
MNSRQSRRTDSVAVRKPLESQPQRAPATNGGILPPPDRIKPRVLVVDDDRLQRWALVESLVNAGCEVVEARTVSGAAAVVEEGHQPVRVVLVDLRLPDGSGLDLLRRLKGRRRCRAILMTADVTAELDEAAHEAGAQLVVGKPFDLNDMMRAVLDMLRDEAR